jgi:hypothetical protein
MKPPQLSRVKILQAALLYADENGVDTLSMRNLAEKLSVKAMSLYNHIKNKDDIIDSLIDLVIGEMELPPYGLDWKESMRIRARSIHKVLLKHKWATLPIVSRFKIGPSNLLNIERTMDVLNKAGFTLPQADHAVNAMDSYIYGFTLIKHNFPIPEDKYPEAAHEGLKMLDEDKYPSMVKLAKMIKNRKYNGQQDFDFGFEFILDGLNQHIKN